MDDGGRSNGVGDAALGRKNRSTATDVPVRVELDRKLESDAAVKTTAQDFVMTDPVSIIGGTPVKRYEKNVAALELLEELLSQGKQATPEQQAILAGYTGWGSFGQELFQGTWDKPVFKKDNGVESAAWKERNLWLRERLGESAWKSAHESTINAHFTDPYTVTAMWSMAEKMGFTGGRVLEPAVGTGNFISLMPTHVKSRSQVTGIDMDMTTAQISKQLFPESNIQNMPYQHSKTPDNFYDLVISNVPFADIKIADRRHNKLNPNVHDYFFLKALDQVRPGGVVMAITSSGTMDKLSEVIRRELAKKAELVTAIRLPSGAFAEYAGTAVVTDIIVLRKRQEPIHDVTNEAWVYVATGQQVPGGKINYNAFYLNHPQNILGTLGVGSGTTRFGAGMIVNRPNNLKERLEKLSDFVPESVFLDRDTSDNLTYYANKTGERNMSLTLQDNQI
ncbi:MAG: class I SAM-dependent methyltransferase, partial [Acinetobacter sp.]